jgi:predicted PurR-regulated permease PerM
MRIQSPFRTGLVGALGVLLALAIGGAVAHLATIITYVFAAIFLALGLDPFVSMLERQKVPRWLALLVVLVAVAGVLTLLFFLVVPVIVSQASKLVENIVSYSQQVSWQQFVSQVQDAVGPAVDVKALANQTISYLQKNAGGITGGVLAVGLGIAGGIGGAVIVVILTMYFTASLDSLKASLYRLVPMSRREKFAHIAEQIFDSVGRYVVGQVSLALINGVLSFIFLSIIGAKLPAVFAFLAFLGSLIPLVGTISGAVLIVLGQFVLNPQPPASGLPVWAVVGIYYLVYMQVEAYILSPNIMNRAVKVPGVIVVIAALVGGTLLGVLGALVAIPVAAAILLIIEQVVVPRQAEA